MSWLKCQDAIILGVVQRRSVTVAIFLTFAALQDELATVPDRLAPIANRDLPRIGIGPRTRAWPSWHTMIFFQHAINIHRVIGIARDQAQGAYEELGHYFKGGISSETCGSRLRGRRLGEGTGREAFRTIRPSGSGLGRASQKHRSKKLGEVKRLDRFSAAPLCRSRGATFITIFWH